MMSSDNPKETDSAQQLREATAVTLRALALEGELEVSFGHSGSSGARQLAAGGVMMPQTPQQLKDLGDFRGRADRHAFWRRYHDHSLAPGLTQPEAQALWHRLEQVRTGLVGTRVLDGCRANLADSLRRDLLGEIGIEMSGPPPVAAAALLFGELTGEKFDLRAHDRSWVQRMRPGVKQLAAAVGEHLEDQQAFTESVVALLRDLDLLPPEPESSPEPAETDPPADAGDSDSGGNQDMMPPEDGDDSELQDEEQQATAVEIDIGMESAEGEDEGEDASWLERELSASGSQYQVYCREYDQVATPSDICSQSDLRALRSQLTELTKPYRAVINQLANRLGRLIAAQQNRRWQYDLEEGLLDTNRLHRVISRPLAIAPYKQEQTQEFPDTLVSLLIDNSGSQRGKAIALAAVTGEIVASTLERCGVRTEILGFTTSAWRGGQSRKKWTRDGSPRHPGRLNDLLHVLYKPASMPWRRARRDMGLMLMPDLLKENIDGEALIWAHDRLLAEPEERRILMVISDGAPVDDSTLSANDPGYLDGHLREVIKVIEKHRLVELAAIGIGHDVSRYYSRALTLHRAEELGPAVLNQLAELFARPPAQFARRRAG